MISDKYKLMFVHNPKCAGTSIKTALQDLPDAQWYSNEWHYSAEQLLSKFPACHEYMTFGCVRNPYDRLVSAFSYNIERVLDPTDYHWDSYPLAYQCLKKYTDQHLTEGWGGTDLITTFREFVMSNDFPKIENRGWPIHFRQQCKFLNYQNVHYILKYEDFMEPNRGLEFLEEYTGHQLMVPYTNMSAHPVYQEFYNVDCMDRVAKAYFRDFVEFGYHIHMLGELDA